METYHLPINEELKGTRLDKALSDYLDGVSRSYLQKLIKEGYVTVNDRPEKASFKLNVQDRVMVTLPDEEPVDILPEDIPLDILYEDPELLVVNKPKGMVVHPSAGHSSGTLVNALLYH